MRNKIDTQKVRGFASLFCFSVLCPSLLSPALAQTVPTEIYPLQIILPRPAGTSPDAGAPTISPNHRIFRAYPGVLYNIRAAVVGGVYPYSHSLENAPIGMTVDSAGGEIEWRNPQTDAPNIVLKVTDAAGTQISTTWSIGVDSGKFIFLNASSPNGGSGTFASPYNKIFDIPSSTHVGKTVYFMSGTYHVQGMPQVGANGWERVEFNGGSKPLSWVEFPGQSAVIDFGWGGSGIAPLIRLSDGPIYLDGFETVNSHIMAFQLGTANFAVIRRMDMHDHGPGVDGANAAFLMFLASYGFPSIGTVIQDNTFSRITYGSGNCALKMYSLNKSLVEDNIFHGADQGGEALIALKSDNPRFTVRRNTFYEIAAPAIGGNMHRINHATYGEILHNNVRAGTSEALFVNQDGQAGRIDIYRNTLLGRVRVRNTDSGDGPFLFYNNVIVSTDPLGGCFAESRLYCENVTDRSRVITTNNLEGNPAQNIADSTGNLTAGHLGWFGTHGFQLGPGGATPPLLRLELPTALPAGSFYFRLANAPPGRYVIRASTNLVQWLPVATNRVGHTGLEWEDSTSYLFRYYQAVSP